MVLEGEESLVARRGGTMRRGGNTILTEVHESGGRMGGGAIVAIGETGGEEKEEGEGKITNVQNGGEGWIFPGGGEPSIPVNTRNEGEEEEGEVKGGGEGRNRGGRVINGGAGPMAGEGAGRCRIAIVGIGTRWKTEKGRRNREENKQERKGKEDEREEALKVDGWKRRKVSVRIS